MMASTTTIPPMVSTADLPRRYRRMVVDLLRPNWEEKRGRGRRKGGEKGTGVNGVKTAISSRGFTP
jgi:hypothetical protein